MTESAELLAATFNFQAAATTDHPRHYVTGAWQHAVHSPVKRRNIQRLADASRHLDFLGVQESDPGSMRSGFKNQGHLLSGATGLANWTHQTNRSLFLGSSGNALFSRHGLLRSESMSLPSWRRQPVSGRGLLLAEFCVAGRPLTVAVTHLSLLPSARRYQADFIAEKLSDHPVCLLLGDFNTVPESPDLSSLARLFDGHTRSPSYPRWHPAKAIDSIWWKSLRVSAESAMEMSGSDHVAVCVNFTL